MYMYICMHLSDDMILSVCHIEAVSIQDQSLRRMELHLTSLPILQACSTTTIYGAHQPWYHNHYLGEERGGGGDK